MMWMRMAAEADPESMAMYVREVNRVHAAVRVPDDEIHARRPTFDPGNQLWVAATWFQSMIDTYSLLVCEIDDDVRDDLLAEFAKVATFLQVREESWPADMQAFKATALGNRHDSPIGCPDRTPAQPRNIHCPGTWPTRFSTYPCRAEWSARPAGRAC